MQGTGGFSSPYFPPPCGFNTSLQEKGGGILCEGDQDEDYWVWLPSSVQPALLDLNGDIGLKRAIWCSEAKSQRYFSDWRLKVKTGREFVSKIPLGE